VKGIGPEMAPKETRKMEQLPQWLADAVQAAGMTCFAEGLEPRHGKHAPVSNEATGLADPSLLPLH
jgi:hypothetical protein